MSEKQGAKTLESFPIVGIGASAGGLAAFRAFFSGMPPEGNPDMAFVLIQHLPADHKSLLVELIQNSTRMQVCEIEDGMVAKPNCVFIAPPGKNLALMNGQFHLLDPGKLTSHRWPIDFFFRSLALNQHDRAIGIVLSGTGGDGTLGVRAIKGEGGMVIAQTPQSAEYNGMPQSALDTGLVDYELMPAEMAQQLMTYVKQLGSALFRSDPDPLPPLQNAMTKVFLLLRTQTGHDFSLYKSNTVHRQVEQRMAVHQIESLESYVKYLQESPEEVDALFRDLLIGVTVFFRDPDAFEALRKIAIPKLFEGKTADFSVRVWVSGCSTGEEAYSIAILLLEHAETLKQAFKIQVFATDIDSRAIATARAGVYDSSIASDVTAERLARFFSSSPDGSTYRIQKKIRDMIVFSKQDLIRDPPFSRLDLISCRNLLIYLSLELQKKLIPSFYYGLRPEGMLFLGTSEGIGEFESLFSVLDRQFKIYLRKENADGKKPPHSRRFLPPSKYETIRFSVTRDAVSHPEKPSLRQLTERALLQHVFAAGVLVNAHGDILYLHGRTGLFLEPSQGESTTQNIIKMAREGLHAALVLTLRKAVDTGEVIRHPNLSVKTNGHYISIDLTIRPVPTQKSESPYFLVILEELAPLDSIEATQTTPNPEEVISALRNELRAKEEFLLSTQDELMNLNEALKSANEEMQSMNEELQSSKEELETSKEELQSINEELSTVNLELQAKVTHLSQVNNDMNNLVSGTGIGTVFVDHQKRILRFTPSICNVINLIPSDIGRPVCHIVSNILNYDTLASDIQQVLDTLISKELEVKASDQKWYSMRIRPYRTNENVIEGAVISFFDITEMVNSREALKKALETGRLAVVVRDSFDAIIVHDLSGRITSWNPSATRIYGWSESEGLKLNIEDRIPKSQIKKELEMLSKLSQAKVIEPYVSERLTKNGERISVSVVSSSLIGASGQVYAIASTERANSSRSET